MLDSIKHRGHIPDLACAVNFVGGHDLNITIHLDLVTGQRARSEADLLQLAQAYVRIQFDTLLTNKEKYHTGPSGALVTPQKPQPTKTHQSILTLT